MLGDAERRKKFRVVRQNFRRRVTAVKFAEQAGDGFDHQRIGIAIEETISVAEFRNKPKPGETAGNQICIHTKFRRERRTTFCFFNEEREPVLSIFQRGKLRDDFNLLFREVHGAEKFLISVGGRFFRFRRTRRLLVLRGVSVRLVVRPARLVVARGLFLVAALRLVMARAAHGQLVARRLDAAERAAEFLNLALVGELLALGEFDEFEDFVQLVNRVFERLGDFRGVRDGLADGRGFRRTKIGGFDPRLGALRFRALRFGPTLVPAVARGKFSRLCGGRTNSFRFGRSFSGRRGFFGRRGFTGFFGMRFAKIAGGVGFRFRALGVNGGFSSRFRHRERGRNFLNGSGGSFSGGGARAVATTTAAATAASSGTARSGGQVQIGLFVRHKFSREDGGFACKCNGELVLLFHKQRQGGGVSVQKIFFTDRTNFTVAEKTGQAGQVEMFLHQRGVVTGAAK